MEANKMRHFRVAFNFMQWKPTLDQWTLANQLIQWDEAERISKFVFKKDAKASMAGRLLLRKYICESLKIGNRDLKLQRSSEGRPIISGMDCYDFNVSHQGSYSVLAMGPCEKIGVDIMKMEYTGGRSIEEFFRLMRRQFTPEEWLYIEDPSLSQSEQIRHFYRMWSLKESYVKAIGIGLGMNLQRINFKIKDDLSEDVSVDTTTVQVDGKLLEDFHFIEDLLDNQHCVSTCYQGQKSSEHEFKFVGFDHLIEGLECVTEKNQEIEALAVDFMGKLETPKS